MTKLLEVATCDFTLQMSFVVLQFEIFTFPLKEITTFNDFDQKNITKEAKDKISPICSE